MHRYLAFSALLALAWSNVAALGCDVTHAATETHEMGAEARHHGSSGLAAQDPSGSKALGHGESGGCMMMLGCGAASVRQACSVAMMRVPALFVRVGFFANPIPVAADLAVEPPPPRQAI